MIENEALPGTGVAPDAFWRGPVRARPRARPEEPRAAREARRPAGADRRLAPARRGKPLDAAAYAAFLREIGYLVPEGADFSVDTANVDPEIASIAGPQLVVPVMNARYALNAANARWGSLYDALYGTDAMGDATRRPGLRRRPRRAVIAWAKAPPRRGRTARRGSTPTSTATASPAARCRLHVARAGAPSAWPIRRQFAGYRGDRPPTRCCCGITACTSRS
jgi:malate synthase